jgi:hypothetical protein
VKKEGEEVQAVLGGGVQVVKCGVKECQAEIEVDIEVKLPLVECNTIDLLKVKEKVEVLKEEKVLDIIWEFMNYL